MSVQDVTLPTKRVPISENLKIWNSQKQLRIENKNIMLNVLPMLQKFKVYFKIYFHIFSRQSTIKTEFLLSNISTFLNLLILIMENFFNK